MATLEPPVNAVYQFTVAVPDEAVADNVTVPASQRLPGVLEAIDGMAFTVATTAVLLAVVQPLLVASV